jgi:HK97 family phage portal protein
MGILSAVEKRMATTALADKWYQPGGFFYGGAGIKTKSGATVSELSAMQLSVVWCCIKIIAEDTASLPLHLYRRLPNGGKERAVNHPLYRLSHLQPNPEMGSMSFRETYAAHLLAWGNAYAEKVYGKGFIGRNTIEALHPITPNRVTPKRNEKKQIVYKVSMAGTGMQDVVLPKAQVLHTPGLSFDGLVGYSPIAYARQAIGLGLTLEEFGSTYFQNGIRPSFVVSVKGQMKDPKTRREALEESYAGLGNAHRILLLEEAEKVERLGIPNDEAQFLETRKFQNIDIGSRIYRLPPQMYGEFEKAAAYASSEQFAMDYLTKALRAWLVRLEQSYTINLLTPEEQLEYFFEHLVDGLLRGDIESRYNAYAVARDHGWMNADEIRELENMNPMPDGQGKIYLVPLNMVPADQAGKEAAPDNRSTYRQRLEKAYSRLFASALGRCTRKEAQRITAIRKNGNDFDEFYRDFPEYVQKQALPAFLSFAEALFAMETDLRGLKNSDFQAETERFCSVFCRDFAQEFAESGRKLAPGEGDFQERDAAAFATEQVRAIGDAYLQHIAALLGG